MGKMLDECFEPIVHAQTKFTLKKASVVGMGVLVLAGLLTSQFFLAFVHNE